MGEIVTLGFAGLLVVAAVSDLMTMTISNRLTAAIVVLFPVAAVLAGLPVSTFGLHLAAGAGMLALCFALFAAGWIGGGDAKLAAGIALWVGPAFVLEWTLLAGLIGGVLTLLVLMVRQVRLPLALAGRPWIARLSAPTSGIPYGVALAAAGLVLLPDVELFAALSRG